MKRPTPVLGAMSPKPTVATVTTAQYMPVEAPRYAMAVVVEHGQGGSKAAAPIAKDIMQKLLEKYRDPAGAPVASVVPA